jgi:TRAP-type C4-dicarboxylate transport system substrate-binding protein
LLSLFKALGAAPVALNISEGCTGLQTKVVDGQENSLVVIDVVKFYEVQKYVSMTNHMWDAFFMVANGKAWARLPGNLQEIVAKNLDDAAPAMRADTMKLDLNLVGTLKGKGMIFNDVNPEPFRLGSSEPSKPVSQK